MAPLNGSLVILRGGFGFVYFAGQDAVVCDDFKRANGSIGWQRKVIDRLNRLLLEIGKGLLDGCFLCKACHVRPNAHALQRNFEFGAPGCGNQFDGIHYWFSPVDNGFSEKIC